MRKSQSVQITALTGIVIPVVLAVGVLLGGCASTPVSIAPGEKNVVRIGISEGVSSLEIEGSSDVSLTVGAGTLRGRSFKLVLRSGEIHVSGDGGNARGRKVTARSSNPIRVGTTRYRGEIEVFPREGGLTVVNVVDVEEYLCGVVPREIGYLPASDIEAVKAQAMAARTYAYAHFGRRISRGFDLYADTRDQVYGGMDAESDVGNRAVRETAGRVITYQGRLIEAFYHSTCGGSTVNIEDVWQSPPLPYLVRVYDADETGFHCEESRHFRWVETYSSEDAYRIVSSHLSEGVADAPVSLGRIRDISVTSRSQSGRAQATRITTVNGSWDVPKERIRAVLRRPEDGRPLRSSYIRTFVDHTADGHLSRLIISGGGNGHGIGMCQWGAIGMSRKSYTAEEIIEHYYRGVEITQHVPRVVAAASTNVRQD